MATTRCRQAKVGVTAVIILMFSIVMFIGSLFYLSVHGPWKDSSPFEPRLTSVKYEEPLLTQGDESPRMKEFMLELSEANCTILFFNRDISTERIEYLNYYDFKVKALENKKIVICSEMENGELALLIFENSNVWIWKP